MKWTPRDIIDKDVLELIGAKTMLPEKKEDLYKLMMDTVETRVVARVDDLLSDDEASQVRGFLEADDYDGFAEFMTLHNVDIKKIYAEESLLYKIELTQLLNY